MKRTDIARLRGLMPVMTLACLLGAGIPPTTAVAQCSCGSAGCRSGSTSVIRRAPSAARISEDAPPPPHGGQASTSGTHWFEVVYLPHETRVYLYGRTKEPVSARAARGEIVMQVFGQKEQLRAPLQWASRPGDPYGFLVASTDVSRVRNSEMLVTVNLEGLPIAEEPTARFSQVFALTRRSPEVAVVPVAAGDEVAIARQQVCPLMDARLGQRGEVIKVLIDGWPLYLCCQDCVEKVRQEPLTYLQKAVEVATREPSVANRPPESGRF